MEKKDYIKLSSFLYRMTESLEEELDISELGSDAQKLGRVFLNLQSECKKAANCIKAFAKGDFSEELLPQNGFLSSELRVLQTFLSQSKIQKNAAKEENRSGGRHDEEDDFVHFFFELLERKKEWVLIVDAKQRKILCCSRSRELEVTEHCQECVCSKGMRQRIINWNGSDKQSLWDLEDEEGKIHSITSFATRWKGKEVYVHIVSDVTANRNMEKSLSKMAYRDPGTGIYNRYFFEQQMNKMLDENQYFTFCYLDLDGLKYVNDVYGHREGDMYIQTFVSAVKAQIRSSDLFARIGGDEFCIVLTSCGKANAEKKMEAILEELRKRLRRSYHSGFSYGIIEVQPFVQKYVLDDIMRKADEEMYIYKRRKKKKSLL